jgi:hypothetical protein
VAQTLTTMLTVVTALGAIWAALVSTRQAQASSVLARVAQQGLEEQISSFRQQNELAREQNERARREEERSRISFEVDMLFKLADRFNSPIFGVYPIFRTVPIVNFRPSGHVAPRILPAVGTQGWNAVVSGCRPPL